jgi:hypothetical protein
MECFRLGHAYFCQRPKVPPSAVYWDVYNESFRPPHADAVWERRQAEKTLVTHWAVSTPPTAGTTPPPSPALLQLQHHLPLGDKRAHTQLKKSTSTSIQVHPYTSYTSPAASATPPPSPALLQLQHHLPFCDRQLRTAGRTARGVSIQVHPYTSYYSPAASTSAPLSPALLQLQHHLPLGDKRVHSGAHSGRTAGAQRAHSGRTADAQRVHSGRTADAQRTHSRRTVGAQRAHSGRTAGAQWAHSIRNQLQTSGSIPTQATLHRQRVFYTPKGIEAGQAYNGSWFTWASDK